MPGYMGDQTSGWLSGKLADHTAQLSALNKAKQPTLAYIIANDAALASGGYGTSSTTPSAASDGPLVNVQVGGDGMVLVLGSAILVTTSSGNYAEIDLVVDGNTQASGWLRAMSTAGGAGLTTGAVLLVSGLAQGTHSVTFNYWSATSGDLVSFYDRSLVALPL